MKPVTIQFEDLMELQDEQIKSIVEQVLANRQVEEMYDQVIERQLLDQLAEIIEEKLTAIMMDKSFEDVEEALERLSLEEIVNYDVPQEIADDIDSLAMDKPYSVHSIFKKIDELDLDSNEPVRDRLVDIEFSGLPEEALHAVSMQ